MTASNIFGRQVILPLTNKSGGGVVAGDVVIIDSANNDAFTTTTTASYTGPVGIAQDTIANNAVGRILVSGYAPLVNVNAAVTRLHYGLTFTVAKQATDGGAARVTGAFCVFLSSGTTPDAHLFGMPDGSSVSGNVATDPIWDAKGDLAAGTGVDTAARVAVGANGTVLSADSAQLTGVAWASVAPVNATYITAIANATLSAEVARPELDDQSLSGATDIDFTSPTSDNAALTIAAAAGMACEITCTDTATRRHAYVAQALGTGDFDVRMRVTNLIITTPHTTTSNPLIAFFVADVSLTVATRLSVQWSGPSTTTNVNPGVLGVVGTTGSGQTSFGVFLPLIFRIARVGTTNTFYCSSNEGRSWTTLSTATAATDFQRVGLLMQGGSAGTQTSKAYVHWLRKF